MIQIEDYNNIEGRYWGIPLAHNPLSLWVMDQILYELKPKTIIELGTFCGGLTLFLAGWATCNNVKNFLTIDILDLETKLSLCYQGAIGQFNYENCKRTWQDSQINNNHFEASFIYETKNKAITITSAIQKLCPFTQFLLGDCFDSNGEVYSKIQEKTKQTPVFLYCDNGDKPKELSLYAPLIPKGSVIGTHDWGTEVHEESSEELIKLGFEVYYTDTDIKTLTRYWIKT